MLALIERLTGIHIHWHKLWDGRAPIIAKCRCGSTKYGI